MPRADDALMLRERINAEADAPARRLLEAYVRAWQLVRDDLQAAAEDAARRAAATGNPANPAAYRTARLDASLRAIDRQLATLARIGHVEVTGRALPVVQVATEVQQALGKLAGVNFLLPPERALAAIVARTTEAVTGDFARLPGVVRDRIRDSLLRGIAGGRGPDVVARRIAENARDGLGLGLSRSMVIARTELLDASRHASRAAYRANADVVRGWRWLATLDARTCPACWSMHNTIHDPREALEGHHQCRCTPVPILVGDEGEDDLGDPRAAFAQLPRQQQLEVMGPRRLAFLDAGGDMSRLAARRANPGWRPSVVVRPAGELPAA